jgi:hypothetical protein
VQIDANNLLNYASSLEGQELLTLKRKSAFAVKVTPDGIEIIPGSTGELRRVSRERIKQVCDEYAHSKSLSPGDYQHITFDASYLVSLIHGFLQDHESGENASK